MNKSPFAKLQWTSKTLSIGMFVLLLITSGLLRGEVNTNSAKDSDIQARSSCINNLCQIRGAEEVWAIETRKTTNDIPTSAEVALFMKNNKFPVCPKGGKYTLGRVGEYPTCSIPDHVLPAP
jgi:hypothetical protein